MEGGDERLVGVCASQKIEETRVEWTERERERRSWRLISFTSPPGDKDSRTQLLWPRIAPLQSTRCLQSIENNREEIVVARFSQQDRRVLDLLSSTRSVFVQFHRPERGRADATADAHQRLLTRTRRKLGRKLSRPLLPWRRRTPANLLLPTRRGGRRRNAEVPTGQGSHDKEQADW